MYTERSQKDYAKHPKEEEMNKPLFKTISSKTTTELSMLVKQNIIVPQCNILNYLNNN